MASSVNHKLGDVHTLQQLKGHSSDVTSCDFAPNFTLVTGSSDKTIRIWRWSFDGGGGKWKESEGSPLCIHKYGVTCVKVSPQGAMFAASSVDGTTTLWNLQSLTRLATLVQTNGDAVRTCRFAPDSSILVTTSDNGTLCLWDLVHRSLIRSVLPSFIAGHEDIVQAAAFSRDSQLLVTGCSKGVVHVWSVPRLMDTSVDGNTGPTPAATLDCAHDLGLLSCDMARYVKAKENNLLLKTYRLATSGNDNTVKIWEIQYEISPKYLNNKDIVKVTLLHELEGHSSAVTCVTYNIQGSLLGSSSLDKSIRIWDEHGQCLKTLESHSRYVNCVAFSRDAVLLASAGSNDKSTIIWDLTGNINLNIDLRKPVQQLNNMVNMIQENEVVRNAEMDDNIELVEMVDDIADGAINCCQFYGSRIFATGSGDKLIKTFDINNNGSMVVDEQTYSPYEGHRYPVNHIDFSPDGSKLVSCSLDGATIVWDTETGEQLWHMPENELGVRVCKFSPDGNMIVTAGDDEKAVIWDVNTTDKISSLEGHTDSINSACFSPDSRVLVTVCSGGDWRLWTAGEETIGIGSCLCIQDNAHDLGVLSCDFSQDPEPIPYMCTHNHTTYLLGTCGNDSLVKLWRITIPKIHYRLRYEHMQVKPWRILSGHGGNVMCLRFSSRTGEVVCSTATDRQARLWSVYSGQCLHVLEHNSMANTCSFSTDMKLLAVGCLDKTLWLWKLPQKLIFQTTIATNMKYRRRALVDWRTEDTAAWARELGMTSVAQKVMMNGLDGQKIITSTVDDICTILRLDEECCKRFKRELKWLKLDELNPKTDEECEEAIPEQFLCPITHSLMRTPVRCCDGCTYERQAIAEWFVSGRYTSPMTNEPLSTTEFEIDQDLRNAIHTFLYNNGA